ncbi:MAG: hypothetical protein ACI9FN_003218 [Saprospiraceae bacterium]|jgi:hypothetical protein
MKDQKKVWIIAALFFAAGLLQIFAAGGEDSLGLIAGGLFILAGLGYVFQYMISSRQT